MRGEAAWPRKVTTEIGEAVEIGGGMRVDGLQIPIEEKVGLEGGKTVAWAEDEEVVGGEERVEISISNIDAMTGAPMTEETRLDVGGSEGMVKEEIGLKKKLGDREIVAGANATSDVREIGLAMRCRKWARNAHA